MQDSENKWMQKWLLATVFSLGLYTTAGVQKAWSTVLNTPGAVWAVANEYTRYGVLGLGPGTQTVPVSIAYPNGKGAWVVHHLDEDGDAAGPVYRVPEHLVADYLMQAARDAVRDTQEWANDVLRYEAPDEGDDWRDHA